MVATTRIALAGAVAAAQLTAAVPWTNKRQTSNTRACAQLADVYESTSIRAYPIVRPSEAYECLQSIPVDADRDIALLDWMRPWLEFQSTVGILADPPAGYMYPGVDIMGGFDTMKKMLRDGDYDNQYDFQVDLYRLINVKPREGHMSYIPALISAVQFETTVLFISISEDGLKLPKVYLHADYINSITSGYEASAVESFDGTPIARWIEQRAVDNAPAQDPDASYNMQLWSAPLENIGATERPLRFYHGTLNDTSTLVFANDTEIEVENIAILQGNWTGVSTGLDVHNRFEIPLRDGQGVSDPMREARGPGTEIPDLVGYPNPSFQHSDNYLSAYLFGEDGGKLSDTTVIAVKSFVSNDFQTDVEDDINEFTSVVNEIVEASKSNNINRLIIDFQGNGGGTIGNLIGLYNVLFPTNDLALHMRARHNKVLDYIGSASDDKRIDISSFFPYDWRVALTEDFKEFDTWDDFYQLEEILGDDFTAVFQPALLAVLTIFPERFSEAEHGTYFQANNTVIVTDGYCASACAMAVGLMSRMLGINTVAMGGRPIEAPMQAIGGTKGGPVMSLAAASSVFNSVAIRESPPRDLEYTVFEEYAPLAGPPEETFVINTANVHPHNNIHGTPAQFIYEAANCKLFYTWETLSNMTLLWEAVADVEWNGAKCVKGSTDNSDDTIASSTVEFSQDFVSEFTWAEGPGDVSSRPPDGDVPDESKGGDGRGGGSRDNDSGATAIGMSMVSLLTLAATVVLFF